MRLWETGRDRRERAARGDDAARAEEQARLQAYRQTFANEVGRRVLVDICRRAGVMQSTFVPGDPQASAFAEGRRRLALEIIETINRDPDALALLAATGEIEEFTS